MQKKYPVWPHLHIQNIPWAQAVCVQPGVDVGARLVEPLQHASHLEPTGAKLSIIRCFRRLCGTDKCVTGPSQWLDSSAPYNRETGGMRGWRRGGGRWGHSFFSGGRTTADGHLGVKNAAAWSDSTIKQGTLGGGSQNDFRIRKNPRQITRSQRDRASATKDNYISHYQGELPGPVVEINIYY